MRYTLYTKCYSVTVMVLFFTVRTVHYLFNFNLKRKNVNLNVIFVLKLIEIVNKIKIMLNVCVLMLKGTNEGNIIL